MQRLAQERVWAVGAVLERVFYLRLESATYEGEGEGVYIPDSQKQAIMCGKVSIIKNDYMMLYLLHMKPLLSLA